MRTPTGKKSILVVDDEPDVRKLVSAMVTHYGYKALTADSGDHAIAIFKKNQPIDLLLTDVVAPGMSGPMLAEKLTELQPGLKVLFMSGSISKSENTRSCLFFCPLYSSSILVSFSGSLSEPALSFFPIL